MNSKFGKFFEFMVEPQWPGWVMALSPEGMEWYERAYDLLGEILATPVSEFKRNNLIEQMVRTDQPIASVLQAEHLELRPNTYHRLEWVILNLKHETDVLEEWAWEVGMRVALETLADSANRWLAVAMWPNGASRTTFLINDRYLMPLVQVAGLNGHERPMAWFMDDLFIPLTTYIDRKLSQRNMIAAGRIHHQICLFVTVCDLAGNSKSWKLDPGYLQAREQWDAVMNEDFQLQVGSEMNTSSFEALIMLPSSSISWIAYSAGVVSTGTRQARNRRVGFFPLVCKVPGVNLSRYQVFTEEDFRKPQAGMFKHCLLWALECAGVSTAIIQSIAGFIPGRCVHLAGLDEMFKKVGMRVEVTYAEPANKYQKRVLTVGDGSSSNVIRLGMIDNHVFINELTPISIPYLRNCWELPPNAIGFTNVRRFNHGVPAEYNEEPVTWSFDVLNFLYQSDQGHLRGMSYYEVASSVRKVMTQEDYKISKLEYDDRLSTREIVSTEDVERASRVPDIWFADYETFLDKALDGTMIHKPYLLVFGRSGVYVEKDCYEDPNGAVYAMLAAVRQGIIYFHNLNYDGSFLLDVVRPIKDSIIEYGGTKILAFKVYYQGNLIEFRDSYAVLPFPLRSFSKMLDVPVEKELMPYDKYKSSTYRAFLPVSEVCEGEPFDELEFRHSAAQAEALGEEVDMWKYAVYYCKRDVEVLEAGYWKMNTMMMEATTQRLWDRYTAPALAFHSLRLKGVFEGCFELTGSPAYFIRKTVIGGRCMLRQNLKQRVEKPVSDFDAVSLYPSAMAVLYTLKGKPKIIPEEWLDPVTWEMQRELLDGYFVEITITQIGRELEFPLISYKEKDSGRRFVNETGTLWVDNITLEDFIEFHKIKYKVHRGYYYDEGKNFTLRDVIREIFELRLKAKKEKKAIEQVYKLLMNSCYGKTIMKPRAVQKNVLTGAELVKELGGTPFTMVGFQKLATGNYLVRSIVDVLTNWSFPTLGAQVLSMSKRLMTRVMSLAQELGIGVYYTDTDSIHIDRDAIGLLSEAYAARYHRQLIGKNLGQFHTDFPTTARGMMWSRKFIGVGKKAYIDCLTDGETEQYHIRLKGIPELSILKKCEKLGITPPMLYDRFFEEPEYVCSFNLCDAKTMFTRKSDFTIQTLNIFERRIKFGGRAADILSTEDLLEPIE